MVFLLSEREISQNYTGIFLDFVHGFGSYVKGLPKTKRCNSVAVTVSVRIRCICETALIRTVSMVMKQVYFPARSHTFVEIDHEIISTVILLPSADSFKKGCCQLQAKVCAQITG